MPACLPGHSWQAAECHPKQAVGSVVLEVFHKRRRVVLVMGGNAWQFAEQF